VEWLQLVYRVPAEPSRKRTYIWRQLRGLGAVYLQDACCVLPRTDEAEQSLATVAAKVREFGGQATLSLLSPAEPDWHERMVAAFNRARGEEYEEVIHTTERLQDELARESRKGKFTFAALEEVEDEYAKLERWLGRVQTRDIFRAPLGVQAGEQLDQVRRDLERFAEAVHQREGAYSAGRDEPPAPTQQP
jgi:hypothetical protein